MGYMGDIKYLVQFAMRDSFMYLNGEGESKGIIYVC